MSLKKIYSHTDRFTDLEFDNIVRNAQSLDHKIISEMPNSREGIDGEIRIFTPSTSERYLLFKIQGKWYQINLKKLEENSEFLNDHDKLSNVRYWNDATAVSEGKNHIKLVDGQNWENHRISTGNPHATQNYQTFSIGTISQRPASPQPFQFFGNTDTGSLEMYSPRDGWVTLG